MVSAHPSAQRHALSSQRCPSQCMRVSALGYIPSSGSLDLPFHYDVGRLLDDTTFCTIDEARSHPDLAALLPPISPIPYRPRQIVPGFPGGTGPELSHSIAAIATAARASLSPQAICFLLAWTLTEKSQALPAPDARRLGPRDPERVLVL